MIDATYKKYIEGYHAGPANILGLVVEKGVRLIWSTKETEWLGHGIYFFDEEKWAHEWIKIGYEGGWLDKNTNPGAILFARIELKICLDLESQEGNSLAINTEEFIKNYIETHNLPEMKNGEKWNGQPIERYVDCRTINTIHAFRRIQSFPPFDTVVRYCLDGSKILKGSTFYRGRHMQICVRNYECLSDFKIVRDDS